MTTRFEELLNSLVTILVRYHDSQSNVKKMVVEANLQQLKVKSRKQAIEILNGGTDKPYKPQLERLITDCTVDYPARRPFLHFILHEINYLKLMLDRDSSFELDKLEELKKQLTQLLCDFKFLLTTTKDQTCLIKYSKLNNEKDSPDVAISVAGLLNTSYLSNSLCNSGIILKEEIFEHLKIASTSTKEEIAEIVSGICQEYQNTLLFPEILRKNKELAEINQELTQSIEPLKQQISKYKEVLIHSEHELKLEKKRSEQLQQRIEDLTLSSRTQQATITNSDIDNYGKFRFFFSPQDHYYNTTPYIDSPSIKFSNRE